MKKRVLVLIFIPLIILALSIPNIILGDIQTVSLIQLEEFTKENVVSTTGKLEEVAKSDITTKLPVVTENVLVEVGDKVTADQVLATVDTKKTKEALMSISAMADFIPEEVVETLADTDFDYNQITSLIPNEIKSDFDGVVTNVSISSGKLSYPSETLVTISKQDKNIRAKIDIPESQIENVKLGQQVIITPRANKDKECLGTVSKIFPTAYETLDGTTKETIINAYVDIENSADLKAGYNIDADIKLSEDETCVGVPYSAINQDEQNREFVYVYKDGKAVKKIVEIGYEGKELAQVLSGVDKGDYIIEDCQKIVKDGQRIFVK